MTAFFFLQRHALRLATNGTRSAIVRAREAAEAAADEKATEFEAKNVATPLVSISPTNHRERSHFDGDFMPRRGRKLRPS